MPDWTVYEVFIASPSNVKAGRDVVEQAIHNWNKKIVQGRRIILLPRRWEQLPPQLEDTAQDYINRAQVDRADILIAFFDRKTGRGTEKEIDLFISNGKSRGTMVYFSELSRGVPELEKLKKKYQIFGLTGEFKRVDDLRRKVKEDLTSCIDELERGPRLSWPRLKEAVSDIHNYCPHLLARFLSEEVLREATEEIEIVRNEARSFRIHPGYNGYKRAVHGHLTQEKGKGTRVLAVCGEKGLRNDQEALDYFAPFYTFPDLRTRKNQVFRAFVEKGSGGRHRGITRQTIKAHQDAKRVVALEVGREKRKLIDKKFPGLCNALDEGFGLVIFVKKDKSNVTVVHQGVKQQFTYAEFKGKTGNHLIALTREIYRVSKQYESDGVLRQELDILFRWILN